MATKTEAQQLSDALDAWRDMKPCKLVENKTRYEVVVACPYCGNHETFYDAPPLEGDVDDEPCSCCGKKFIMCAFD